MYLRITRSRFDPARYDELFPLAQQVDTAVKAQPGNQSCQAGIDRTGGRTIVVSTWDTAEHARLARETAPILGELVQRLQAMGVQMEPAEIYEVVT